MMTQDYARLFYQSNSDILDKLASDIRGRRFAEAARNAASISGAASIIGAAGIVSAADVLARALASEDAPSAFTEVKNLRRLLATFWRKYS